MIEKKELAIEILPSKSGPPTMTVNGTYLHSAYNPIKEARSLVSKYSEALENRPYALILGLGLGHHVQETVLELRKHHGDKAVVFVIEPHYQIYQAYKEKFESDPCVHFLVSKSHEEIFTGHSFCNFLLQRPTIISHSASYNFSKNYFEGLLSYKASTRIGDIARTMSDINFKFFLEDLPPQIKFESLCERIHERKVYDSEEFHLLSAVSLLR